MVPQKTGPATNHVYDENVHPIPEMHSSRVRWTRENELDKNDKEQREWPPNLKGNVTAQQMK